ncbi:MULTISPECIES: hypothetical protein [unclassified Mycolicibacterium]|uniref:hypothetical protein n=1 Tax=unclassified Mycolicibacterium TaxID=2636767 RepID=UPI002ED91C47
MAERHSTVKVSRRYTMGRKAGLGYMFRQARAFYIVIAVATVVGVSFNFVGDPRFRMLDHAAAVNSVFALPLMAMIMLIGNDRSIMGKHIKGRFTNVMGWAIVGAIGVCAPALLGSILTGG